MDRYVVVLSLPSAAWPYLLLLGLEVTHLLVLLTDRFMSLGACNPIILPSLSPILEMVKKDTKLASVFMDEERLWIYSIL